MRNNPRHTAEKGSRSNIQLALKWQMWTTQIHVNLYKGRLKILQYSMHAAKLSKKMMVIINVHLSCIPGIMPSILSVLSYMSFKTTLQGKYYYLHFTNGKTYLKSWSNLRLWCYQMEWLENTFIFYTRWHKIWLTALIRKRLPFGRFMHKCSGIFHSLLDALSYVGLSLELWLSTLAALVDHSRKLLLNLKL